MGKGSSHHSDVNSEESHSAYDVDPGQPVEKIGS